MSTHDRETAKRPEDLTRLFIARARAGDAEGLVALYEPDAVIAAGRVVATGHDEIRRFFTDLLAKKSDFPDVETLPAILGEGIAMTFARLPNGTISAETARRQPDGGWLWIIDQLKIKPAPRPEEAAGAA